MPIIDAYSERKAKEVRQDTWGHLKPKPNKKYKGKMLLAYSEYSWGLIVVSTEFEGNTANNPWFYDLLMRYIERLEDEANLERGKIYKWEGTFVLKTDNSGVFEGKTSLYSLNG